MRPAASTTSILLITSVLSAPCWRRHRSSAQSISSNSEDTDTPCDQSYIPHSITDPEDKVNAKLVSNTYLDFNNNRRDKQQESPPDTMDEEEKRHYPLSHLDISIVLQLYFHIPKPEITPELELIGKLLAQKYEAVDYPGKVTYSGGSHREFVRICERIEATELQISQWYSKHGNRPTKKERKELFDINMAHWTARMNAHLYRGKIWQGTVHNYVLLWMRNGAGRHLISTDAFIPMHEEERNLGYGALVEKDLGDDGLVEKESEGSGSKTNFLSDSLSEVRTWIKDRVHASRRMNIKDLVQQRRRRARN